MAILKSEKKLIEDLQKRHDPEAERLKRFLAMPDLTRTPGSPLADLVRRIAGLPRFSEFSAKGRHQAFRLFRPAGGTGNLPLFLHGEKQAFKDITAFFALKFVDRHGFFLYDDLFD